MIGEQSQVQKNVWTSNGVEELFSISRKDWNSQKNCLLSSRQVRSNEFPIPLTSEWTETTTWSEEEEIVRRGRKQLLDEFERELDKAVKMELGKSDMSKHRRPKGDDVDCSYFVLWWTMEEGT